MIIGKNIYKFYGSIQVLKGIDVEIKDGEIVSITGMSGAGKTTLLQILGTLDKPNHPIEKSQVIINGQDVLKLNDRQMAHFRNRQIGFVFQSHNLLEELNALENICLPALIANSNKTKAIKKAKDLMSFLNISQRQKHKPSELSGGEKQRVAVARSLINQPSIVLADEPSGNLDSKSAYDLHSLFFKLRDEFGQTFVIVTHNTKLSNMADRKLKIADGKLQI